jgi:hypothetical protein
MLESKKINNCLLCEREWPLTFHHLIPKTLHKKKWYQKNYTHEEMQEGVDLCEDCHEAIHDFISEKDLGKHYNSLAKLQQHPKVKNFTKWVSKRGGRHKSHRSKSR